MVLGDESHQFLENRVQRAELLVESAQFFTSSLQLEEVMTRILNRTLEVIPPADAGILFIHDSQTDILHPMASSGFEWDKVKHIDIAPGESMTGLTFEREIPQIFQNPNDIVVRSMTPHNQEIYWASLDNVRKTVGPSFHVNSVICAPLIVKGVCVGVMTLDNFSNLKFQPDDMQLLVALSNQAAVAIENARLYDAQLRQRDELERLNAVIQSQRDQLFRIKQTHDTLIERSLRHESADMITSVVSSVLANPVALINDLTLVVAQAGSEQGIPLMQSGMAIGQLQGVLRDGVIRQTVWDIDLVTHSVVMFPISASSRVLGILVVFQDRKQMTDEDIVLAEQCSLVLALDFLRRDAVYEAEQRLKGQLLDELVTEKNIGVLKKRAQRLGLSATRFHVFLIVDIDNHDEAPYESARAVIRRVHAEIERLDPSSVVINKLDTAVVVLSLPESVTVKSALQRCRRFAAQLIKTIEGSDSGTNFAIGIGGLCVEPGDYLQSYNDAKQCIELVRSRGEKNTVKDFVELGAVRFILNQPADSLHQFVTRLLHPLLSQSKPRREESFRTLDVFIRCGRNRKEAAGILGIHPNTLSYRLKKTEQILGCSLDDYATYFDLLFAWRILDTFNLQDEFLS